MVITPSWLSTIFTPMLPCITANINDFPAFIFRTFYHILPTTPNSVKGGMWELFITILTPHIKVTFFTFDHKAAFLFAFPSPALRVHVAGRALLGLGCQDPRPLAVLVER